MNNKKQQGFSAIEGIIVLLVVLALAAVGFFVYQQTKKSDDTNKTDSSQSNSQNSNEQTTTVEETAYSLVLPAGWQKTDQAPNTYVDELMKAVQSNGFYHYYKDANNNYFAVSANPIGRGFEANETWELTATSTGFTVDTKTTCVPDRGFCTPADLSEYRVGMKSSGALALKGNKYFFFAGNTSAKTGVDTAVFQTILASFTAK